jgi:prepilin-type N-terminal cleavage/methylation domain-containing protein
VDYESGIGAICEKPTGTANSECTVCRLNVKMKQLTKQLGFTLIELMLVVAIIAAISVIGVNAYRQQLSNFQVDKAALQMQQWMEGAAAFYVDCGQWPGVPGSTSKDLTAIAQLEGKDWSGNPVVTCNGKTGAPSGVTYVAAGSMDKSPWGGGYSLCAAEDISPTCNNPTKNFQVSITAPNNQIAQQVAARLPSTDPVGSGTTVTAYIGIPSQGSGKAGAILSVSDYCQGNVPNKSPSNPIPIPPASSCPAGTKPTLHLALRDFLSTGGEYQSGILQNPNIINGVQPDVGISPSNTWTPTLSVYGTTGTQNTNYCMLAIVSCDPVSPATNATSKLPFEF